MDSPTPQPSSVIHFPSEGENDGGTRGTPDSRRSLPPRPSRSFPKEVLSDVPETGAGDGTNRKEEVKGGRAQQTTKTSFSRLPESLSIPSTHSPPLFFFLTSSSPMCPRTAKEDVFEVPQGIEERSFTCGHGPGTGRRPHRRSGAGRFRSVIY